jgi:hypothetical protein
MTPKRLAMVLLTGALITLMGQLGPVAAQKAPAAIGALRIAELSGNATTPIYGFDFSATAAYASDPNSAGKTVFNQIGITRAFDALSVELFESIAVGKRIPLVEILVYKPGTTTVETTYGLHNAAITLLRGAPGAESVAFAYTKIEITGAGKSFCFDISGNVGC